MKNKVDVLYFVIKGAICLCAVPFLPVASTATFTATVVSFDTTTNMVKVINTYGVPTVNQALLQDANGPVTSAVRTLLSYQDPDFIIYSGYMTYIENRTAIQRSSDGTEQFRVVLRF